MPSPCLLSLPHLDQSGDAPAPSLRFILDSMSLSPTQRLTLNIHLLSPFSYSIPLPSTLTPVCFNFKSPFFVAPYILIQLLTSSAVIFITPHLLVHNSSFLFISVLPSSYSNVHHLSSPSHFPSPLHLFIIHCLHSRNYSLTFFFSVN